MKYRHAVEEFNIVDKTKRIFFMVKIQCDKMFSFSKRAVHCYSKEHVLKN